MTTRKNLKSLALMAYALVLVAMLNSGCDSSSSSSYTPYYPSSGTTPYYPPVTTTSSGYIDSEIASKMDTLTSRLNTWLMMKDSYRSNWGSYWQIQSYMDMERSFDELQVALQARGSNSSAIQALTELQSMRSAFQTWRMVQMMNADVSQNNALMMIPFLEAHSRLRAICGGGSSLNYMLFPSMWGIGYYGDSDPYYSYSRYHFGYVGLSSGMYPSTIYYPGGSYTGTGTGSGYYPGTGTGTGSGYGTGTGTGSGYYPGTGTGTGSGYYPGTGTGTGSGYYPGTGTGTGSGSGYGYGNDYGYGTGTGTGSGSYNPGSGYGTGTGTGSGSYYPGSGTGTGSGSYYPNSGSYGTGTGTGTGNYGGSSGYGTGTGTGSGYSNDPSYDGLSGTGTGSGY